MEKRELFVCECNNLEHQLVGTYDKEDKLIYFHIRLNILPFWKRLKQGVKYIFGNTCKYGDYQELILGPTKAEELIILCNKLENKFKKYDYKR